MDGDTRKVDEMLINIVKTKPALYDLRVPAKERTKIIKENIWKEISRQLKGQLEPDAAETRWKYLRENYIKSRRKEKLREDIAKRNGLKESKKKGKHSYRYYEIMEFLNDALDYQKVLAVKNAAKSKKSIEMKLERNFKSDKSIKAISKPLTVPEPEHCEIKEQLETNSDKDIEFEEVDPERSVNSPNILLQQHSNTDNNHINQKNDFEEVFLECLQKPIEKPCPIDGFLVRLGEGLRRLPYRERSKLELEFLTRLHEVEELLYDDK